MVVSKAVGANVNTDDVGIDIVSDDDVDVDAAECCVFVSCIPSERARVSRLVLS